MRRLCLVLIALLLLARLFKFQLGIMLRPVERDERFASWGLAELLCRRSSETAAADPEAAVQTAELAVAVSVKTRDAFDDELWIDLLRGFAWAHVAEARRIAGDWRGAWRALSKAKEIWDPAFANAGDVLGYAARFVAITEGTVPEGGTGSQGSFPGRIL